MNLRNVLYFDAMLTPKVITVVYWLLLLACVIAGLGTLFYTGFQYMSFGTFVRAIGITLGGAIAARIWCELMIVLFKLNENVQRLAAVPAQERR
ncbi:MAG TPA: DUF4282 domain-containing protein [Steroidobacteraceae bacterium]|nr:DUF4282 domain-containing protein [Steroidobacteraceae bacterium]